MKQADWRKFADVKATYRTADQVGRFTVFNVGGNNFRLITVIDYDCGTVIIREVLTHAEYDKEKWNER